jgi:tetratricopeptide (TPR) repeat protein
MTDRPTRTFGPAPAPAPDGGAAVGRMEPGARLGTRYEIDAVLGEGGMGTVYRARDLELGRTVALKVIRPDMASRADVVERFKREILLASQVTHRHVLRIHDLGEAGALRFISMQYVEGTNLKAFLQAEGPLPAGRALPLIRQIGEALQAAHDAGVVHRDLKPQNVLLDRDGNAYIADFGISRSLEPGSTMTETGAIVGTVDYMSPEQARGETPDHRGDVYSFGVILYEMLAGAPPFRAPSALSVMMKRVHEDAPPLRRERPEVPAWLSAVVARALRRDPADRYQQVRDLLRDLDRRRAAIAWRRLRRPRVLVPAAALLLAAAAPFVAGRLPRPGAPGATPAVAARASLAILPFRNDTGDAGYDWTRTGLPRLLRSDLAQARALRLAPEERVHDALRALGVAAAADPGTDSARRVAGAVGVEATLAGSLLRTGDGLRIEATLLRAGAAGPDPPIRLEGRGDEALFAMADDLARRVRDALGVGRARGESGRAARASASGSIEAVRRFEQALALARLGSHLESARELEAALAADGDFHAARARLAETYDRLGYADRALVEAKKAVAGLGRASTLEAARIRAVHARLRRDLPGAAAAYREMIALAPNDPDPVIALAGVLEESGRLAEAAASLERAIALDPKAADTHYALGRVRFKLERPAEAVRDLSAALALHLEFGNDEGRATVLNGLGNAYRSQGLLDEALRHYEQALEIRRRVGDRRGAGVALSNIATVHRDRGRYDRALTAAREALDLSRAIGYRAGEAEALANLGDISAAAGRPEEALGWYQESLKAVRESGDEASLAQALSSIGYVQTVLGRYVEAFFFLKQALDKRRTLGDREEIVRSLLDLGYLEQVQGRYEEALAGYLEGQQIARDLGSRESALALSLNLATVQADQGDYGAALALLEESAALAREVGHAKLQANALTYLGGARLRAGDPNGAGAALAEALRLAGEMRNPFLHAEALIEQADLLLLLGDEGAAREQAREAAALARQARDRRLEILARLALARARRSPQALRAVLEEARAAGLAPLVAPARLALGGALLRDGRVEPALDQARQAVAAATPLRQRDLLVQARALAAECLRRLGRTAEAADETAAALPVLEEMRRGLAGDGLERFLARPQHGFFAGTAPGLFETAGRPAEAARLRALLGAP